LVETVVDNFNQFFTLIGDLKGGNTTKLAENSDAFFTNIQKLKFKTPFFLGENVSVADLYLFYFVDSFLKPLIPQILQKHPEIEKHRQAVANLPDIKAYLASDRRPALTLPPNFGVLCTPEQCK